jgi:hypothetical protein
MWQNKPPDREPVCAGERRGRNHIHRVSHETGGYPSVHVHELDITAR